MFVCYHVFQTYVIKKYVLLPFHLQNQCYYVTMASKLMSLNNMFFFHSVFKTSATMLLWLQNLCH